MNIFGIVDLLAAGFILSSDFSIDWLKWSIIAILLIKGLHSQLG